MILRRLITALRADRAKKLRDRRVKILLDRAESSLRAGDVERAKLCYGEVLSVDDAAPGAHSRLALLLTGSGRVAEALPHYRAAHAVEPLAGEALESYVRVLLQLGRVEEAVDVAQTAVRTHPQGYDSWFSLGLANLAAHRYHEARTSFERSLEMRPDSVDAHVNRGIALQNVGRFDEAHAEYDRALAAQPEHALARFHRSLASLTTGDYARGWPDYQTRLVDPARGVRPQYFPPWDGRFPAGRTLLVYGEQGLGDEIMFASCLPDLMLAGARLTVECNPALQALFTRSFPGSVVYAAAPDKHVPEHVRALGIDWEVPIGSLPLHFRRSTAAFPEHSGYLTADAGRIAAWRARLATLGPGFKVGISWRGGTQATRASSRSIPLDEWLPILGIPGVQFVSLQYTADAPQALDMLSQQHGVRIPHWPEAIADYDETAALVSALDLTLSVCTSVAHLAGALGRAVWVMVPSNPEWRYGHVAEQMPWYPSARLFRQTQERDWSPVISSIERALREHVAAWADFARS